MQTETLVPIVIYLIFTLFAGLYFKKVSSQSSNDFFLAGRQLSWLPAGVSIVATTFAADTPLVITGIIAHKGISGNWLWLSVMVTHAAMAIYFAKLWSRTGAVTDSELISIRYSSKVSEVLRLLRAFMTGIVINCLTMAWVIKAMVKISAQLFSWQALTPNLYEIVDSIWPKHTALGSASEGMTILVLVSLVAIYSSMGGLRSVIYTDFFQFILAVAGTSLLAYNLWDHIGGKEAITNGLNTLYGNNHHYLDLFPSMTTGWASHLELGGIAFGSYLMAQGMARPEADGGGYFMQRLNSCKSENDAIKAGLLFVFLHYLVRVWPWFVIGIIALILIPIGHEVQGPLINAAKVAADRELAFPVLMMNFLSPTTLGILITSFLAAFMSTMDTHLNWGSSYIANDWMPKLLPSMTNKQKVFTGRISIITLSFLAILISFQIQTIADAWKWVAAFSISMGIPSIFRWLWWRVSAWAEMMALIFGISSALIFPLFLQNYELSLIAIAVASFSGMMIGIFFLPQTDLKVIDSFYQKVQPKGVWPQKKEFPLRELFSVLGIVGAVIICLKLGIWIIFGHL